MSKIMPWFKIKAARKSLQLSREPARPWALLLVLIHRFMGFILLRPLT